MRMGEVICLFATSASAWSQTSVQSKGQRGGVTAGSIGRVDVKNFTNYITASDLGPSLVTELKAVSNSPNSRSVYIVFRNPTSRPVSIMSIKYRGKGNLHGLQNSFGMQVVRPKGSIEVLLFSNSIGDSVDVSTDISFTGNAAKHSIKAFHERYILQAGELSNSKLPAESTLLKPSSATLDELFGSQEEIGRDKGEYVFTLPGKLDGSYYGKIDAYHRYFLFNSQNQFVSYIIQYSGYTACWAAPLLPKTNGLHRIRLFWDDTIEKAGLTVDGVEVNNETSVAVRIQGIRCDNAVRPKSYDELLKIWDEDRH